MTSYLQPFTDTQKSIAAFLRRMLRDAAAEYAAENAKFLGVQAGPQVGVEMIPHTPSSGIEEFRLGSINVQFRNDPPSTEEKDFVYLYPPNYEQALRKHRHLVLVAREMREIEHHLFDTMLRSVYLSLDNIPNHTAHIEHKQDTVFTIKPLNEEHNDWRAVVTLDIN